MGSAHLRIGFFSSSYWESCCNEVWAEMTGVFLGAGSPMGDVQDVHCRKTRALYKTEDGGQDVLLFLVFIRQTLRESPRETRKLRGRQSRDNIMEQFLDHSGCGIVVCLYLLLKACVLCFGQVRVDCTFLTGDEIGILLGPFRCMASHIVVASLEHLATEAFFFPVISWYLYFYMLHGRKRREEQWAGTDSADSVLRPISTRLDRFRDKMGFFSLQGLPDRPRGPRSIIVIYIHS